MTALIVKNKAVDGIKLMHSLHLNFEDIQIRKSSIQLKC